ncbi:MAG: rpfG3 [Herbinix sp.]|jgi:putative two-component system response regulator|nr:rpfG3 [Herbinix sp.]
MKQVFILGDNQIIQREIEQVLMKDYNLVYFGTMQQPLEYLKTHTPDIILITADILQEEVFTLLRLIKRQPELAKIPVLCFTDRSHPDSEQKALKAGAMDCIEVPFIRQFMKNRVDNYIKLYECSQNFVDVDKYQESISVSFAELVECRDVITGGHIKNVVQYFKLLLDEVISREEYADVITPEERDDLLRSALLHDIGKIGINDDVLRKASPLDYDEFEYMKTHTILGSKTIEKIIEETGGTRFLRLARDLAFCHHERWDGTGYPNGLKGEEIPIYARILTIADVYDALTSKRAYKEAYPHKKAVEILLEGKGSLFDPNLIDIFEQINDRFEQVLLHKKQISD